MNYWFVAQRFSLLRELMGIEDFGLANRFSSLQELMGREDCGLVNVVQSNNWPLAPFNRKQTICKCISP